MLSPLDFPQAVPSSMMDPRQSTTVPKVSKISAFTAPGALDCARASSRPMKTIADAPMPAEFISFLRVISSQAPCRLLYTSAMPYAGGMRFLVCGLVGVLAGCGLGEAVSPLIAAARDGNVDQIKRLAAMHVDLDEPGGVNHWTPLMNAIHKNQTAAVEVLLELGARPNMITANTSALIMAAGYGQLDNVQTLLRHGADPKLAVRPGVTALAAAVGGSRDADNYTAGKCQTDVVKLLLERDPSLLIPADSEAVQTAQKGGCTEVVALVTR